MLIEGGRRFCKCIDVFASQVDAIAVARLTAAPDLCRPYVVVLFKSQDHGCRSSIKLSMIVHDFTHIRYDALTMHARSQHFLITLISFGGLKHNIDSGDQFLQSCPPLFLTET